VSKIKLQDHIFKIFDLIKYFGSLYCRSNVLIESGIDKHWDNIEKHSVRLVIRNFNVEFKPESFAQVLSLEDIKWSFFLLMIGWNLALVFIIIESVQKNLV
jgi:hypothetical protein